MKIIPSLAGKIEGVIIKGNGIINTDISGSSEDAIMINFEIATIKGPCYPMPVPIDEAKQSGKGDRFYTLIFQPDIEGNPGAQSKAGSVTKGVTFCHHKPGAPERGSPEPVVQGENQLFDF